jgi:hypothetical protein
MAAVGRLVHLAPAAFPTVAGVFGIAAAMLTRNWTIPRERGRESCWEEGLRWCASLGHRGGPFIGSGESGKGITRSGSGGKIPCTAAPVGALGAWGVREGTAEPLHVLWHGLMTSATARNVTTTG